jgi:hypothetical protein
MIGDSEFQVRPVILRPLVFRTFLFLVVSLFILFTAYVNYYLLGIDMPSWILWSVSILTGIILLIDWTYTFVSDSNAYYVFYPDRIQLFRATLNYSEIDRVELKRSLFDKLMKTGSIKLYSGGKKYYVRYVPDVERISVYINSKIPPITLNHKL